MGAEKRRGAIVLVVFGQVGLRIGELWNFELIGVGEEHCWSEYSVDLLYQYLIHCFQFSDVFPELRRDVQFYGRVSGRLNVF